MHSKVIGGAVTKPIPIRVGGVKISTVFPIGERRGGLACKIAKWMTGYKTLQYGYNVPKWFALFPKCYMYLYKENRNTIIKKDVFVKG